MVLSDLMSSRIPSSLTTSPSFSVGGIRCFGSERTRLLPAEARRLAYFQQLMRGSPKGTTGNMSEDSDSTVSDQNLS